MSARRVGRPPPGRHGHGQGRHAEGTGRRAARRRWRLHRFLGFLLGASALAAVAVGLLQHRLRQGPLDLPMIAELAESRLNVEGGALRYRVGGASFDIGAPGALSGLVLSDLAVIGLDGSVVAAAPRVAMELAPGDLIAGRVQPRALRVAGVSLTLLRRADGSFGLRPGGADEDGGGADPAVAAALLAAPGGPLAALDMLVAEGAEVILRDEITGRDWRLSEAELTVVLGPDLQRAGARGRLSPLEGGGTPAAVSIEGRRDVATGEVAVEAAFADLALARLAEAAPELAPLAAVEASASGEAQLRQGRDGALMAFDAALRLGPGRLAAVEGAAGRFDAATMELAWEPQARRLRIDRIEAEAEAGRLAASGAVTVRPAAAGWSLALDLESLSLSEAAGFAEPVAFDAGALRADVLPGRGRVEVSRLSLGSSELAVEGRAALERGAEGWTVAASVISDGFSTDALTRHWPPALAPGGRRWVAANLRGGQVRDVETWLWLAPGERPQVTLDFGFEALSADIVRGLPPVDGGVGRGRATLSRLDLSFEEGGASLPDGGRADLAGSRFSIPDLAADPPVGVAALSGRGRLPDLLALLDRPPLGLVSRLGADLSSLDGRAEVSADLRLPLLRDLKLTQVSVSAEATLTDVTGRPPDADLALAADRLSLSADLESLRLEGGVRLDGLPARLAWTETYGGPAAPARRIDLSATVDGDDLARLGLTAVTAPEGRIPLSLRLEGVSSPELTLTAELQEAELALPGLGWSKPAGRPGRLSASGRAGADGLAVERFELTAADLTASGSARLGPDGGVRRVELSRLALEGALDVTVALTLGEDGAIEAEVGGDHVDLGAVSRRVSLAGDEDDAGGDAAPPLTARIAVDRVIAAPGFALHRARGRILRRGEVLNARLRGDVNGGGPALLRYRDEPPGDPLLSLRTQDAGRLLADLGLSGAAAEGRLSLSARLPRDGDDGAVTGVAEIEGIRVADAAALGRVLDRAEAEGRLPPAARKVDGGYLFETVRVPFTLAGSELRVERALAVGPSLGITLDGAYDRAAERLDFDGVLTPAYAINGLLNRVPLVGALFGGEGEGLFALTFSIEGPRSAPEISANPLSILTPGVFRRLLQGAEPREAPPDLFREMER